MLVSRKSIFFALLFCFSFFAKANTSISEFDKVYTKIATEVASSDIKRAFKMSDSLLVHSADNYQKMKCLMLLATLHQHSGDVAKALAFAIQAEKLVPGVQKKGNWEVRIAGFLSTLYRSVNLTEQARKYLDIAEKKNMQLEPSPATTTTYALILQEKAYYAIEEDQDYTSGMHKLQEAEQKFLEVPNQLGSNIFLATNDQLYGLCYLKEKNYDKAKAHLFKALAELKDTETELKAFIYAGLGDVFLENHQYEQAIQQYKKAEPYANQSDNFNAKIITNKGLASYYNAVGDSKRAFRHQEIYSRLLDEQAQVTKSVSNQLIKELNKDEDTNMMKVQVAIAISIILLLLVLSLLYINQQSSKRNRLRYEQVLKRIDLNPDLVPAKQPAQALMTKESEDRLLAGLHKLEEKKFFLQGDASLSTLASKLNSNTKYLSYIINRYKEKDFNNYVNELRITYALKDLQLNPIERKYKISYLAKKYGFSSHSKFAAVFKATTGISPSVFIENLRKDEAKEDLSEAS